MGIWDVGFRNSGLWILVFFLIKGFELRDFSLQKILFRDFGFWNFGILEFKEWRCRDFGFQGLGIRD